MYVLIWYCLIAESFSLPHSFLACAAATACCCVVKRRRRRRWRRLGNWKLIVRIGLFWHSHTSLSGLCGGSCIINVNSPASWAFMYHIWNALAAQTDWRHQHQSTRPPARSPCLCDQRPNTSNYAQFTSPAAVRLGSCLDHAVGMIWHMLLIDFNRVSVDTIHGHRLCVCGWNYVWSSMETKLLLVIVFYQIRHLDIYIPLPPSLLVLARSFGRYSASPDVRVRRWSIIAIRFLRLDCRFTICIHAAQICAYWLTHSRVPPPPPPQHIDASSPRLPVHMIMIMSMMIINHVVNRPYCSLVNFTGIQLVLWGLSQDTLTTGL